MFGGFGLLLMISVGFRLVDFVYGPILIIPDDFGLMLVISTDFGHVPMG